MLIVSKPRERLCGLRKISAYMTNGFKNRAILHVANPGPYFLVWKGAGICKLATLFLMQGVFFVFLFTFWKCKEEKYPHNSFIYQRKTPSFPWFLSFSSVFLCNTVFEVHHNSSRAVCFLNLGIFRPHFSPF